MNATLEQENSSCKRYDGKALLGVWVVITPTPEGGIKEWARATTSGSPVGRVYASVWITTDSFWSEGSGWAGGGGYHKESAAVGGALEDAGVKLSENICGAGDAAIREALCAVAEAAGAENPVVITVGAAS